MASTGAAMTVDHIAQVAGYAVSTTYDALRPLVAADLVVRYRFRTRLFSMWIITATGMAEAARGGG